MTTRCGVEILVVGPVPFIGETRKTERGGSYLEDGLLTRPVFVDPSVIRIGRCRPHLEGEILFLDLPPSLGDWSRCECTLNWISCVLNPSTLYDHRTGKTYPCHRGLTLDHPLLRGTELVCVDLTLTVVLLDHPSRPTPNSRCLGTRRMSLNYLKELF